MASWVSFAAAATAAVVVVVEIPNIEIPNIYPLPMGHGWLVGHGYFITDRTFLYSIRLKFR